MSISKLEYDLLDLQKSAEKLTALEREMLMEDLSGQIEERRYLLGQAAQQLASLYAMRAILINMKTDKGEKL